VSVYLKTEENFDPCFIINFGNMTHLCVIAN